MKTILETSNKKVHKLESVLEELLELNANVKCKF